MIVRLLFYGATPAACGTPADNHGTIIISTYLLIIFLLLLPKISVR